MSGVQSVAFGALALCFAEVLLTSKWAPERLAAGAGNAKNVVARIVDPTVPLFGAMAPDSTDSSAPGPTSNATPGTPAAAGTQSNEGGGEGAAPSTSDLNPSSPFYGGGGEGAAPSTSDLNPSSPNYGGGGEGPAPSSGSSSGNDGAGSPGAR